MTPNERQLLTEYSIVLADLIIAQDLPRDRIVARVHDALSDMYSLGFTGGKAEGSRNTYTRMMELLGHDTNTPAVAPLPSQGEAESAGQPMEPALVGQSSSQSF